MTATLLFATIDRGAWMYAAVLFIVANIGVATSLVFYDSLLPHIAAEDEMDRVSTAGYAIGFIGGGILLLVNLAWILSPTTFGIPDTGAAIKLSFISVGDLVAASSRFRCCGECPSRPRSSRRMSAHPTTRFAWPSRASARRFANSAATGTRS